MRHILLSSFVVSAISLQPQLLSPERRGPSVATTRRNWIVAACTAGFGASAAPASAIGGFALVSAGLKEQSAKCATARGDDDVECYRPAYRTECAATDIECLDARRRRGKQAAANYIANPWSSGYTYLILLFVLNALSNFVSSLKWKDDD